MSKRCTKNLGKSNRLVDPWEVNWQKECDITWLYGPLYQRDENGDLMERCLLNEYPTNNPKRFAPPRPVNFCPSRKVKPAPPRQDPCATSPSLKSVLKYRPSVSRHAKFDSLIESWIGNAADDDNDIVYHQPRPKRSNSWTGTHVSASRSPRAIRFNPHVLKVEFIPTLPVVETIPRTPPAPSPPKTRSQDPAPKARSQDPAPRTRSQDPAPRTRSQDPAPRSPAPPVKRKSPVHLDESRSLIKPLPQSKGLSEACFNLVATVKDIVTLCGVIVIYRGISVGVSPVVWLAQHWVQHLAGRDARL